MKIKVWDLPTRLFHWSLVGAYIAALFTSRNESFLEYHVLAGYFIAGCVIFRTLWGFVGNRYARFSSFIKGFGEVRSFLSRLLRLRLPRYIGHNPAVGWMVLVILGITTAITVTGIVTYGGEENRGVFAGLFPFGMGMAARTAHIWLTYCIVAVVAGHVSAALIHDFVLKENIILSMITGAKEDDESWHERVDHLRPEEGHSAAKLAVYLIVVLLGAFAAIYLPPEGRSDPASIRQPRVVDDKGFATRLVVNNAWHAECADCHDAFHPTLLPAASWKKIMAVLGDHFGDTVSLDESKRREIETFLVSASAEHSTTEASKKLLYSLDGAADAPIRITDVPYWKDKHSNIREDVFKRESVSSRSNCSACHPWAEAGSYEDRDISIPQ
ncbi:MAG: cytochrome b/b6 domain-containing protein [Deltaproteobacteria bacterium]|nr:cytochrome b/b6 domain-containing protein [Deltaproteobacteria bacterium]